MKTFKEVFINEMKSKTITVSSYLLDGKEGKGIVELLKVVNDRVLCRIDSFEFEVDPSIGAGDFVGKADNGKRVTVEFSKKNWKELQDFAN